mmetsp:Transcript_24427/g.60304  ORF Transcript_24427/g.60304 Transcript_24427/m.60304 type:complete len:95 (+) Transcript_24427:351-635(+)
MAYRPTTQPLSQSSLPSLPSSLHATKGVDGCTGRQITASASCLPETRKVQLESLPVVAQAQRELELCLETRQQADPVCCARQEMRMPPLPFPAV